MRGSSKLGPPFARGGSTKMSSAAPETKLRQRKKDRTRRTIIDVGTTLFAEQGYDKTTIAQIADAAEIASSTFFNYFSSKADIVFGLLDAITQSASDFMLVRAADEPANEAVVRWIANELPGIEAPFAEAMRRIPEIIAAVPELQAGNRLRLALLEDVFAEAFARDFGGAPGRVRARVMASIVLSAMESVWETWYRQHAADAHFDPTEVFAFKADYVARALSAGTELVASLPPR
jgi:AcrR family transcriptional regulator